jgi:pimeloyl-ACP methyl ester carboxylesterase
MHANSVAVARRPVNVQRAIRHLGRLDARAFTPRYPARSVTSWTTASRRETAVEVSGAGHMAPLTHPERVNALIERFLDIVNT